MIVIVKSYNTMECMSYDSILNYDDCNEITTMADNIRLQTRYILVLVTFLIEIIIHRLIRVFVEL